MKNFNLKITQAVLAFLLPLATYASEVLPLGPEISGELNPCVGVPEQYSVINGGPSCQNGQNYIWYIDEVEYIGTGTSITHTFTYGGPISIRVIYGDCAAGDGSVPEIFVVGRSASTPGDPTITSATCGSTTIQLPTAASGETNYWVAGLNGSSPTTNSTKTFTSDGNYYIRAQDGYGCWGPVKSGTVDVQEVPFLPVSQIPSFPEPGCEGSEPIPLTLPSGGGTVSYYWQSTDGGTSFADQSALKDAPTSGLYYFRGYDSSSGCWGATGSYDVQFKAPPPTPTASSYSIQQNGCNGGVTLQTLAEPENAKYAYRWKGHGSTDPITVYTSGTYELYSEPIAPWYDGCSSTSFFVQVTAQTSPATPAIVEQETECGFTKLGFSAQSGVSYYWQSGDDTNNIFETEATGNSDNPRYVYQSGTYYLRAKVGSCWSTAVSSKTITVREVPTLAPFPNSVINQCGQSEIVVPQPSGDITYYWQNTEVELNTDPNRKANKIVYPEDAQKTFFIRARHNTSLCWNIDEETLSATANPKPMPTDPQGFVSNRCGYSLIIPNPTSGDVSYYWQNTTGELIADAARNGDKTVNQEDAKKTFYIRSRHNTSLCWNEPAVTKTLTANPKAKPEDPVGPVIVIADEYDSKILGLPIALPGEALYWEPNTSSYLTSDTGNKEFTIDGVYYIRARNTTSLCWSDGVLTGPVSVRVAPPPYVAENYIWSYDVVDEGITDEAHFSPANATKIREGINYFDGIGRPMQSVQMQTSPGGFDIVQPITYDKFGRQVQAHLPYSTHLTGAGANDGTFKPTATADQTSFYNAHFNGNAGDFAFSETVFDDSPLNRPVKTFAPGEAWSEQGGNKPVSYTYETNAENEVRRYDLNASGMLVNAGYFLAGKLYKNSTKDENQSQVIEYKDLLGKVVLKSVEGPDNTWLQTYYVYDDFGNLRFVIPPEASKFQ